MSNTTNNPNTDIVVDFAINRNSEINRHFVVTFLNKDGEWYYEYYDKDDIVELLNSRK